jgi:gliding motility-associated-like protein
MGGTDFFWSFGDGTTSRQVSPTKLYTTPGTYTVKLVAVDTNTCNLIDSTQSTIIVSDKPTAAFTFSPNPPEENIITTFTNNSTGAVRYKWLFGDGDSLITIRRDTIVKHQYPQTGSYNACLIAINQYDCPDTTCREVAVIINPLLDVVNAFTPNGDGVNDRAVAIGYGIAKMTFRIYNRWGQLMFESNDISLGWDGKFNGKPQPMDAYAYTLDAALVDGTPVRKAGSITLVR